ncbi:hypothetical protein [Anaerotignum sp. MB30-C6]|nr:hypothetical protein [Anaerotignum sp. MB30-C6]WMI80578.1 hypothetical protein RBQ60_12175 [Anaerotignum sp. MB30-C6]
MTEYNWWYEAKYGNYMDYIIGVVDFHCIQRLTIVDFRLNKKGDDHDEQ